METKQFTLATLNDTVVEAAETFTVSLNAVNPLVTDTDTATGTITDNDSAAVTVENVTAVEGGGLLFTVMLNNAVQSGTMVNVTLTDATATGGAAPLVTPEDYGNVVAALSFTGTAGETKQFTVASLNDTVVEAAETFTVSLNAVNPLVTDTDTASGTITDNDSAAVTVENMTAVEGGGLVFTVTLNNAVQGGTLVNVTLTDVTATGGAAPLVTPEDYNNVLAALSFTGTAGETKQFTVATLNDAMLEVAETFTVNLNAVNPLVIDADTATGTITDNDSPEVTVENVMAVEGVGLVFTVTLTNALQGGTLVNVTLSDVTATGGAAPLVTPEDYNNVVAALSFAGTAGETKQFTVATLDDTVVEASETFKVSFDAVNPLVTDTDTATGTITDNDITATLADLVAEYISAINSAVSDYTVYLHEASGRLNEHIRLINNMGIQDSISELNQHAVTGNASCVQKQITELNTWYSLLNEAIGGYILASQDLTNAFSTGLTSLGKAFSDGISNPSRGIPDIRIQKLIITASLTRINSSAIDAANARTDKINETKSRFDNDCSVIGPASGATADRLTGNADKNSFEGGGGDGTLIAGEGNDTLIGGANSDVLDGGIGNDTITGGTAADSLLGGSGIDLLTGAEVNDTLAGQAGIGSLSGGAGSNTLFDTANGTSATDKDDVVGAFTFDISTLLGGLP